jgi:3-isopropylmalate dehydrogenase
MMETPRPTRLLVLPGDGVGPEVVSSALDVLNAAVEGTLLAIELEHQPIGMAAYREHGMFVHPRTLEDACTADAVLFGAEGGPDWDAMRLANGQPGALMQLRKRLQLFANIRPVRSWPLRNSTSALRSDVAKGADLLIVRELSGGVYTGTPRETRRVGDQSVAIDTQSYSSEQISRVSRLAMELARSRSQNLVSIDKSNVMETGRLWRSIVTATAREEFRDVALEHLYADYFLYALIQNPRQFDVILADNLFGDLASDCAGAIAGSMGLLPSASFGLNGGPMFFEPVHGAASDIAGTDRSNPIGAILCVAMMLEYVCRRSDLAAMVVKAVEQSLEDGISTPDIGGTATTWELTESIVGRIGCLRSEQNFLLSVPPL